MSSKNPAVVMPNKDIIKTQPLEAKVATTVSIQAVTSKLTPSTAKVGGGKCVKDAAMSPGAPSSLDAERTELLGSLTTQQQQRTSARVIKKLRLEPPVDRDKRVPKKDGGPDDIQECETTNEKDHKFPTVKQRMPKALWSADEKSLFFEALNECGKDFDAITAYICAKLKKKGMPDVNLKTKTQVSHFYYRTWHKLSKHVHFDEKVKKVAQELYALINYGELRKKLVSVNEKTCARLGELVLCGSLLVRARGRNVRVRTPMCRALRNLNQITELSCGLRVCSRATISLRARDLGAWSAVQRAAHNPRCAVSLPLRATLHSLLRALHRRWRHTSTYKPNRISESLDSVIKSPEEVHKETEDFELTRHFADEKEDDKDDLEDHQIMETDRIIVQEHKAPKKLALHVGPRPGADIHLPVVSLSEQLSSQKICFSSYLERMGKSKDSSAKIRTPKRQRKDSTTDKDKEGDQKKFKMDGNDKLINIEDTAIDGIELMASYKHNQEDEEKPSTEDEKERDIVDEDVDRDMQERDKYMSEREKDSFSEMEDDEKYNKSDTDNESDHGKDKSGKEAKFKNLKVKFRIRPKKRGGSIYTLVTDKEAEEGKFEDPPKEDMKGEDPVIVEVKSEREDTTRDEESKPQFDVEMAMKQIRKGWSMQDAGELTIGDLYLMFGSRSKLELDYWWAEPTPPLPQPQKATIVFSERERHTEKRVAADKTPDKGTDSSVEDEKERARESDNDLMSPKNAFSQDSNDGMSGDERKSGEQLSSPDHKSSSCSGTLKLVSKLINRPQAPPAHNGFALMSDRLKRLLALAGNPHVTANTSSTIARCNCGHVCPNQRRQKPQLQSQCPSQQSQREAEPSSTLFRHPTPIAPRPDTELPKAEMSLEGLPRWRRGRPRLADRRVVVQRLLPLLPKLPPPSNLIPVKIVANTPPTPPRILPKPPPTTTADMSFFYVLSESNGQFYFHDGDRRIPISPLPEYNANGIDNEESDTERENNVKEELISNGVKLEGASCSEPNSKSPLREEANTLAADNTDTLHNNIALFRQPTPIAPRPDTELPKAKMSLEGLPRWRRGRPRLADRRVVVQRLLPLLPKLPPPSNLIPVKIVAKTPPAPPRILPKLPPTTTADMSFFYVLSESNGQFYFHDGDRRIPISPLPEHNVDGIDNEESDTERENNVKEELISNGVKLEGASCSEPNSKSPLREEANTLAADNTDTLHNNIAPELLVSESLSLSPSRLLREADGWLEGAAHDFSFSSFLSHLDAKPQPDLPVDSHLHSLMAESSVDYVAKFADLAAEVTDEVDPASEDVKQACEP